MGFTFTYSNLHKRICALLSFNASAAFSLFERKPLYAPLGLTYLCSAKSPTRQARYRSYFFKVQRLA